MNDLFQTLRDDENGFIVSAELVLVSTIAVLGMVVGLAEVSNNVNQELEDVGSAFGAINQSYSYCGNAGHKGRSGGSRFDDSSDYCDTQWDIVASSGRGEH